MANAWKHPDMIAAEALMSLQDNLVISNYTSRDKTGEFVGGGMKVGDTVRIRTRPDYSVNEFTPGGSITIQDVREGTRPFAIEKHFDVSVEIGAKEKALDLDSFAEQVINPAMIRLAEKCDQYVGTKILEGRGMYTSTALLESAADVALARKAANYQQLDPMGRLALVDDTLEATLLGQTWFNQSQTRGAPGVSTLQSGTMGTVMGINWESSLNFPTTNWTPSTGTGSTNNGGGTNNLIGTSILTTTALTAAINAGDHIQVAGMRRPMRVATTAALSATSIELVDPIDEIVPDSAAITVIGSGSSYIRGAIFDDASIGLAMPPLDAPSDKPSFVMSDNGYSVRIVQGYDMTGKVETLSLDLLIGATAWDTRRITLLVGDS